MRRSVLSAVIALILGLSLCAYSVRQAATSESTPKAADSGAAVPAAETAVPTAEPTAAAETAVPTAESAEPAKDKEEDPAASDGDGSGMIETGSFDELIRTYFPQYQALTADERAEIAERWTRNRFRFADAQEMAGLYAGHLDRDAAILLLLWNERQCLEYVLKNYQGEEIYREQLAQTFNDAMNDFVDLWQMSLPDDGFRDKLLGILWEAYRNTAEIGDAEGSSGTHDIAQGVFGYGEACGAEDAEAFFRMVDGT